MKTNTILLVNVGILLVYLLVVILMPAPTDDMPELARMIMIMSILGTHSLIMLVTALVLFFMKRPQQGKAFLLSMVVVLVIGVASCFGVGAV